MTWPTCHCCGRDLRDKEDRICHECNAVGCTLTAPTPGSTIPNRIMVYNTHNGHCGDGLRRHARLFIPEHEWPGLLDKYERLSPGMQRFAGTTRNRVEAVLRRYARNDRMTLITQPGTHNNQSGLFAWYRRPTEELAAGDPYAGIRIEQWPPPTGGTT